MLNLCYKIRITNFLHEELRELKCKSGKKQ